jgi:uncharacterized protein YgbK (DUF1537 family)
MAEILVVADDLTGANAAAAGFSRSGLRAVTASAAHRADVVAEMAARFDVVVATTDSRHASPAQARERVRTVVRAGWPSRLVCNRIDTTLRGNVGATTEALRDEVAELVGTRVVVLCAPAHPEAARHTIGGTQLLDGVRLEDTEVARDARTPVRTSVVKEILAEQSSLATAVVPLEQVTGTAGELEAAVRTHLEAGADVIVADAMTVDHLERVARAAVAASADLDLVWVTSDPGPASVAMARALGIQRTDVRAPLLVVSGSTTDLTRAQLQRLLSERGGTVCRVVTLPDSALPDLDATARAIDEALRAAGPDDLVVVATALEQSDLRPVTPEEAEAIPVVLARAVRRNLEEHPVGGLFTTGGDVTAAVLAELGSHGLEIAGEVVPLAVSGSLVGGPWDGTPIVTKGGLVGEAGTTVACLDHLAAQADLRRRQVAAAQSRTT